MNYLSFIEKTNLLFEKNINITNNVPVIFKLLIIDNIIL